MLLKTYQYGARTVFRHVVPQTENICCRLRFEGSDALHFRAVSQSAAPTPARPAQQKPVVSVEKLSGRMEGLTLLSLERPELKNAISKNLLQLLRESLESLRADRSTRIIILRSAVPGVFCSGADLRERSTMKEEDVAPFVASLRSAMHDLYNFPVPTIAAIDGFALGGGFEMALACDLRVASSTAKMGLVETKLGIIPGAGGTQFLTRLVGVSRAKEMIFTGEVIDGDRALALGVASQAVEQNAEGNAAFNTAVQLADKMLGNGPVALKMAKIAIGRGMEVDLSTGLLIEEACYAQIIKTKDRLEGLAAFKDKRKPQFKGE